MQPKNKIKEHKTMCLVYRDLTRRHMGNCITIPEENTNICAMCNTTLSRRYVYCIYCEDRFHYRCLQKYNPHMNTCASCKKQRIKFLDANNESVHTSKRLVRNSI